MWPVKFQYGSFVWLMRAVGYAVTAAIILLSLIPSTVRPHTGAGGMWEHVSAYALAGLALGLGHSTRRGHLITGLALSAGAAALEGLQNFVPGRTPELAGWIASAAGAWIGLGISAIIAGLTRGFVTKQ